MNNLAGTLSPNYPSNAEAFPWCFKEYGPSTGEEIFVPPAEFARAGLTPYDGMKLKFDIKQDGLYVAHFEATNLSVIA